MKIVDHVTIAMKRPAGPPASARETSALAGGAWFEARTPAGQLRLYAARLVRHAADAAVALGRCEPLLAALDAWLGRALGAPLDWQWIAVPGAVTASATHARVHWHPASGSADDAAATAAMAAIGANDADANDEPTTHDRDGIACRLELPWTLVRNLPAPPAGFAAQLQWPEIPMVLAASQWHIPDDELALLEPGGAVVLPASMQPAGWRGWLRALDERAVPGAGMPVDLAQPQTPRRLASHGEPPTGLPADGGSWCEVRLMLSHALPADRLTGWFDGPLGDAGAGNTAGAASLWFHAAGSPARMLAAGTLMPWADGWALRVDQVGI